MAHDFNFFLSLIRMVPLKAQLHQFKFSLKNTYFIQTALGNKNQVHIQLNPVTAQCYQSFSTQILFVYLLIHRKWRGERARSLRWMCSCGAYIDIG